MFVTCVSVRLECTSAILSYHWTMVKRNVEFFVVLFLLGLFLFSHFANSFSIRFPFTYHALAFYEPRRLIKSVEMNAQCFAFKSEQAILLGFFSFFLKSLDCEYVLLHMSWIAHTWTTTQSAFCEDDWFHIYFAASYKSIENTHKKTENRKHTHKTHMWNELDNDPMGKENERKKESAAGKQSNTSIKCNKTITEEQMFMSRKWMRTDYNAKRTIEAHELWNRFKSLDRGEWIISHTLNPQELPTKTNLFHEYNAE